jgi:hypothetical protein
MSAALLGAQAKSTDNSGKSSDSGKAGASAKAATVTFTGCVTPGSTNDSFYLINSKQKGAKAPATTMKLVPATKKVGIGTFVTQGVEVTGTLEQAADGASSPSTLTVTKIKSTDSGC